MYIFHSHRNNACASAQRIISIPKVKGNIKGMQLRANASVHLSLFYLSREKRFSQKPCGKSHLWCPGQNPVGIRPGKQVLQKDFGIITLIDAFEQWYWSRLLRVPWTARRSNQSVLKEIYPECSLERLVLKLKLQYLGHLMQKTDSLEKTLTLGKDWGQEEKGATEDEMVGWHRWLDGHEFEQALGDSEGQISPECCSLWGQSQTQLSDWTISSPTASAYCNMR